MPQNSSDIASKEEYRNSERMGRAHLVAYVHMVMDVVTCSRTHSCDKFGSRALICDLHSGHDGNAVDVDFGECENAQGGCQVRAQSYFKR